MELILQALQIQARTSREQTQIEGCIPAIDSEAEDLVTTEQTSGCMFFCDKPCGGVVQPDMYRSDQKPLTVPFRIFARSRWLNILADV